MPNGCTAPFAGFGDEELAEETSKIWERNELAQILLVHNPFCKTGLTMEQEEDLLSEAEDQITVSSDDTELVRPLPPPIPIDSSISLVAPLVVSSSCKQENALVMTDSGISSTVSASRDETVYPSFRFIPGTTFAVDALQHADVLPPAVVHFLSSFREGLKADWISLVGKKVVMTREVADRVQLVLRLDERFLRLIEPNKPITVDGTRVTALNGHQPGLVMFLFQTKSGLNILHTGECQPCAAMEEGCFWNCDVHVIFMNTSYLSRNFTVQSQVLTVTDVCGLIRANQESFKHRLLLICGKNLAVKELAKVLNFKVWIQPGAASLTTQEQVPRDQQVNHPSNANIHLLADEVRYDKLISYLDALPTVFGTVLSLRPSFLAQTSFDRDHSTKEVADPGPVLQRDVYDRTRRFLSFLKPLEVVSTGDDNLLKCEPPASTAVVPAGALSVTIYSRRPCCNFCDTLKLEEED